MIRVASVPEGHVYVRHLADPCNGHDVVRLPDPGGKAWPSALLSPQWIDQNAESFDVFHIHFGFDALSTRDLTDVLEALDRNDKPLVYTVHDLRNPHHLDRLAHDEALDVLIPAAAELITLTAGAAQEIRRRWDREATVLPHPHVVDPDTLHRPRQQHARPRIGVHLKSLRASIDPLPILAILEREVPARKMELVIDVHTDVMTPGEYHHDAEVAAHLKGLMGKDGVTVHVHDYYSDDELWDYFLSLDLSVLPYRFGTHSGWLEACYDVGTHVLAPLLGHYHDQHPGIFGYRVGDDGPSVADIAAALDALPDAAPWRADPDERHAERQFLAGCHADIYRRAMARVRT
ncbi:glycosyltransferase family 1 protein [Tessaracoccus sp. MC1756]|uniref:glycosyltransferase family 1 protein n=1 Tax=Tessaracoccus sp. MC1756 TaxID=2760311 RepID=UPI0016005CD3|nr:glycosyltransferase family 1 protein [Tessaracoccus sp. MC1756]MBB1510857.1 glycosyltransferase family 1 protein [Tessaracoccus sp. MC1756]